MERAVADIVGSPSFQFYERPHDIMDIDPVLNFLYGLLGDQREVRVEGVSLKKGVKYCKFTKFFQDWSSVVGSPLRRSVVSKGISHQ